MDPLKFRQRRLFRQQAIEYFVGALGDGSCPELLIRGLGLKLLVIAIFLLLLAVFIF